MKLKAKWFFGLMIVILILFAPISIIGQTEPSSEGVTFESVTVDGDIQHYVLYTPENPIGGVLIIPSYVATQFELLEDQILDENWEESHVVKAAKKFGLALVMAAGAAADFYSPNKGEKRVLACLDDANASLKIPSESWFIYGFSMGGAGAITISLRHPGLFGGLYVGDGLIWTLPNLLDFLAASEWDNATQFLQLDPLLHLELFRDKTLFLASGTNNGAYNTNVLETDNFSLALNDSGIKHYYYRGVEDHSVLLLFNSMNLTFNMFSHSIAGTLDQFYADPLTLKTIPTTPTTPTTTPAWMLAVLLIALFSSYSRRRTR
ncbi:MAG: hypothetical protein ACFFE8_07475 [Candidatus Heimdallarchaeota archaeon]